MKTKPIVKMRNFSSDALRDRLLQKLAASGLVTEHQNIEIRESAPVHPLRQHHLWHSGEVLSILYGGYIFELCACGDIKVDLLTKDRPKDNCVVESVRDKSNNGNFVAAMKSRLKNDDTLSEVLTHSHSLYELDIYESNWWEAMLVKDGEYTQISDVLDADLLEDALVELLKEADELIRFNDDDDKEE